MSRNCRYHPDRNAVVTCEKHEHGYCEECLEACTACSDPELYCRHRQHCIIWEQCRKVVKEARKARLANEETEAG